MIQLWVFRQPCRTARFCLNRNTYRVYRSAVFRMSKWKCFFGWMRSRFTGCYIDWTGLKKIHVRRSNPLSWVLRGPLNNHRRRVHRQPREIKENVRMFQDKDIFETSSVDTKPSTEEERANDALKRSVKVKDEHICVNVLWRNVNSLAYEIKLSPPVAWLHWRMGWSEGTNLECSMVQSLVVT